MHGEGECIHSTLDTNMMFPIFQSYLNKYRKNIVLEQTASNWCTIFRRSNRLSVPPLPLGTVMFSFPVLKINKAIFSFPVLSITVLFLETFYQLILSK